MDNDKLYFRINLSAGLYAIFVSLLLAIGTCFVLLARDVDTEKRTSHCLQQSQSRRKSLIGATLPADKDSEHINMRYMKSSPSVPLILHNDQSVESLMTYSIANDIRKLLPLRLQLKSDWQCIYSLERHGSALSTLYEKCNSLQVKYDDRPGFVMILRDEQNAIFGGYLNQPPQIQAAHYGNGECFLYKVVQRPGQHTLFKAYTWTGLNDYQLFGTSEFFSIGGGDGKYGLWIDDKLEFGLSSRTLTFGNDPLSSNELPGSRFRILSVEIWSMI